MDTAKHRALFWTSAAAALFTLIVTIGGLWYYRTSSSQPKQDPAQNSFSTSTSTPFFPETKTVVFIGDSITAGYGLPSLTNAYPSVIEKILHDQGYNVSVINSGVTDDTTGTGLRRAQYIALQKPDVVVIALGKNDAIHGIDPIATRSNLDAMIRIFTERNIAVILAGIRAPDYLGKEYVQQFNIVYPDLATKYTLPFIPFLLKDVAGNTKLMQPDSIHPNTAGARIVANTIVPVLKRVLGITK